MVFIQVLRSADGAKLFIVDKHTEIEETQRFREFLNNAVDSFRALLLIVFQKIREFLNAHYRIHNRDRILVNFSKSFLGVFLKDSLHFSGTKLNPKILSDALLRDLLIVFNLVLFNALIQNFFIFVLFAQAYFLGNLEEI